MSSLVLLLLLCLSLHACNARHLGLVDKKSSRNAYLSSKDDVEKAKLHETSIPSRLSPSILEEHGTQKQREVGNTERITHESWAGAITMNQKDSKALSKEEVQIRATSGEATTVSHSQKDLQLAANIEALKRQGRSMLGSAPHDDTEEAVDSKESDVVQDIVVMDYAQPHRKPPIHNEKP